MFETSFYYLIVMLVIFNFLIIFNFSSFQKKINIYDHPNVSRKKHNKKVSITGGLIIFLNIIFFLLFEIFLKETFDLTNIKIFSFKQILIFTFTLSLIFLIGLYDDKYHLNFEKRLLYLFLILFIFFNYNPQITVDKINLETLGVYIEINKISSLLITIAVLSYIISLNMFDGINLQSCFYCIIIFLFLINKNIFTDFNVIILLTLFFIFYLNYKNKLFLGDGGVYLLGFLLSYNFIYAYKNILLSLEEIILISLLPILDCSRVIMKRIFNGKNPAIPDRTHIHHLLQDKFYNKNIFLLIASIYLVPIISYHFFDLNILISILIQIIIYFYFLYFSNAKKH